MAKTVKIAVVFLRLPDGSFVFQRRGKEAPTSPGLLGLFGGHMDESETPAETVARELAEETTLDVSKFSFQQIGNKLLHYKSTEKEPNRHFFYFLADIQDAKFKVLEGDRAETYSWQHACKRNDLTRSTYAGLEMIERLN